MKPNLTTFSLVVLLILFGHSANSQERKSANQQTIVKQENPYGKAKTKWLNANGFETKTYDWSDPEINLFLDQSVKRRSAGNIIGITGGSILVLGLMSNIIGHLSHEIGSSKPDESYQVFKAPYYLGGAMVATSISLHLSSNNKLSKARIAKSKR